MKLQTEQKQTEANMHLLINPKSNVVSRYVPKTTKKLHAATRFFFSHSVFFDQRNLLEHNFQQSEFASSSNRADVQCTCVQVLIDAVVYRRNVLGLTEK